jgi:hypothetical protein
MTSCAKCQWEYPDHMVRAMLMSAPGMEAVTLAVCPICALDLSNEIHGGPPRTRFDGPQAERLRKDALRWRKAHPRG